MNPGQAPTKASEAGTKHIIVPNVERLTDKRRIAIGEELWRQSGRPMDRWNEASEDAKLRFSQTHMGRYEDVEVKASGDEVSWTSKTTSSYHSASDVTMLDLSPKS